MPALLANAEEATAMAALQHVNANGLTFAGVELGVGGRAGAGLVLVRLVERDPYVGCTIRLIDLPFTHPLNHAFG